MSKLSSDACGKFIISGEHAVLDGAPCLVYPVRKLRLQIERTKCSDFDLRGNGIDVNAERKRQFFEAALRVGFSETELKVSQFFIRSEIPLGSGLGSSAALCVALARMAQPNSGPDEIFAAAFFAEGIFHGRSSGADPAGVTAESPILYRMAGGQREEFVAPQGVPYFWALRDSGATRDTARVIEQLKTTDQSRKLMSELSAKIPDFVAAGQVPALIEAINELSRQHREMGLVTAALEECFESMRAGGAVATKLTGAGRGGFALGLYPVSALASFKDENFIVSFNGNDEVLSVT
jgi:mevalonate kinase